MDCEGWPPVLTEVFGNVVRNSLGGNENKDFGILSANLVKVFDQFVALLKIAADVNNLLNVMVGSQLHGANVDLDHVLEKILEKAISN